ncbi:hypothetical protein TREMEDRAFT_29452 [Tremella mesenterica DSM 1558]|uniref:uncharacterized protein n=1 Tax=Tremella mesenterica (strain ATCC 24925 / CBS 8224 / DSM 1558 / NBRC 9311 / NRRL Y-6157 / RJB 2259-6 / UBC 559-6) TaxID=578456 RepID=UPI0003F4A258|nr:uncharacterized protein TREMEDRAFT_29452 [Tremella mesenterica DSM 1558]EIW70274.1 hypothetical protein TREMEDRAFT_29452 [Tremella mesenterica DSM 1558]
MKNIQRQSSTLTKPTTLRSQLYKPTTILLLFVPLLTGALGVWQLKRLKWKLELIDEVEKNMSKEALILPSNINLDALPDFTYRRVLVKGTFTGPPILLGPQVHPGVPGGKSQRRRTDDWSGPTTILVNRGFITNDLADKIRSGFPPPGMGQEVILEGILSKGGEKSWSPDNRKEKNEWYWKDLKGMVEFCGGEKIGLQPVLVDAIDDETIPASFLMQQGIPVGKPPIVELRNQHASYAATWFSLSAATTVMLGLMLRRGTRSPVRRRDF